MGKKWDQGAAAILPPCIEIIRQMITWCHQNVNRHVGVKQRIKLIREIYKGKNNDKKKKAVI